MDSSYTSTVDNGKTASPSNGNAAGFRSQNGGIIKVQPPRREDLQPSYAQTLQRESDDPETNSWYGSMSMSGPPSAHVPSSVVRPVLTSISQQPGWMHRFLRSDSVLHHLPEPVQAGVAR